MSWLGKALGWLGKNALGLLGIGTSTAGSAATIRSNEAMQARQLNHADTAATIAYQRQNELQDKQNLYNSPVMQMERFKAAGLNPYLMYGEGGATVSAASANVQQANTPAMSYQPNYYEGVASQFQTAASNIINMQRLENETMVAKATADKLRSEAQRNNQDYRFNEDTYDARARSIDLANRFSEVSAARIDAERLLADSNRELNEWKRENIQASTAEINARRDHIMTQRAAQEILNRYLDRRQAAELSRLAADTYAALARGRLDEATRSLASFNAMTARLSASAAYQNSETNAAEARHRQEHDWKSLDESKRSHDQQHEAATKYTQKDLGHDAAKLINTVVQGGIQYYLNNQKTGNSKDLEAFKHLLKF